MGQGDLAGYRQGGQRNLLQAGTLEAQEIPEEACGALHANHSGQEGNERRGGKEMSIHVQCEEGPGRRNEVRPSTRVSQLTVVHTRIVGWGCSLWL